MTATGGSRLRALLLAFVATVLLGVPTGHGVALAQADRSTAVSGSVAHDDVTAAVVPSPRPVTAGPTVLAVVPAADRAVPMAGARATAAESLVAVAPSCDVAGARAPPRSV
jgi:hypothetical protein